ncbi:MAG: TolC family protein [Candidatus Protistobacter heckmanni]|nr:TolC family protein [Candidatus Protistobacter heckmanni]
MFEKLGVVGRFAPKVTVELTQSKVKNAQGAPGWQINQSAMVVVTLPILNGGTDYYQARSVAAKQEGFRYDLTDTERQVQELLNISYSSLRIAEARLNSSREELVANAAVADAYDEQLKTSNRNLLDVLDAYQRLLYQSQTDLVRISTSTLMLQYQIQRTMGALNLTLPEAGADTQSLPTRIPLPESL